jgi:hypothetical protein
MVGALVWRQTDGKYLVLPRSAAKDFAAGPWECVTGRLEQGESVAQAVQRDGFERPGVLAYGQSPEGAKAKVQASALRAVADRLDHGEAGPGRLSISFAAA